MNPAPLGVYVHWPYCARICPYCDFNVVRDRGRASQKAALVRAIVADLKFQAREIGARALQSIFLGGGTPSLMEAEDVEAIIEAARSLWPAADDLEVTLEANPTDAETGRFDDFARAGVNRLSLGLQSLDDGALTLLGRNHDAATGRRAAEKAASSFPRLSIDMIYALPGQTAEGWERELQDVIALGCEHISPYQLTIEPGTAFHRAVGRGSLKPADEDLSADLYEATQNVLLEAGFDAYEVSNHARGHRARSRHNLIYWRGQDYVGVGPGAHGRLTMGGKRWATLAPRSIEGYIEAVDQERIGAAREALSPREAALERLLMGLRTLEGVDLNELTPLGVNAAKITALEGLAEMSKGRVVVTPRGRPVLDRIVRELAHGA